jgi:hypothetical protein
LPQLVDILDRKIVALREIVIRLLKIVGGRGQTKVTHGNLHTARRCLRVDDKGRAHLTSSNLRDRGADCRIAHHLGNDQSHQQQHAEAGHDHELGADADVGKAKHWVSS